MLLIHYVNLTHFESNPGNFWVDVKVFLILEIFLYVLDQFNMLFNFYILIRAHQFHFNFSCIQAVLFVIHFVDNIGVLILKVSMAMEVVDDSNPTISFHFWLSMNITIGCTFAAMFTLFFLTVERCCATVLIHDYERKPRKTISVLLNALLLFFGVVSCFIIKQKENTVYIIAVLLVINGFALVFHGLLGYWNRKIYGVLHKTMNITAYSLTQRFQVSENIKVLHMMKNIIFYMGLMNLMVVLSVLFSSFELSPEIQLLFTFCLDTSIFIYSFCYPVIMYQSCEKWRSEIDASLQWIFCCCCFRPDTSSKVYPIMNSFGEKIAERNTMNNHFDHLKNSWDAAIPRKSLPSLDNEI